MVQYQAFWKSKSHLGMCTVVAHSNVSLPSSDRQTDHVTYTAQNEGI